MKLNSAHHAKASIEGVDLQIQTPLKNPKATAPEVDQIKKTKPESDDEDPFEPLNKLKNKLSLKNKKK